MLVSFKLVFMPSISRSTARFDVEVYMLLILGEYKKNSRSATYLFFEHYSIRKSRMTFIRPKNRLCIHNQLSAIKKK